MILLNNGVTGYTGEGGRKLLGAIRTVAGETVCGEMGWKKKKEERRSMDGDSGSLVKKDW